MNECFQSQFTRHWKETSMKPCVVCAQRLNTTAVAGQFNPTIRSLRYIEKTTRRHLSESHRHQINQVKQLADWNLDTFREQAFKPQVPVKLPLSKTSIPPACNKWFIHDANATQPFSPTTSSNPPQSSELRTAFWSDHEQTLVPLELTTRSSTSSPTDFHRTTAPLKILLTYLSAAASNQPGTATTHSIYLAQCSLTSLPESLQVDLPIPNLVTSAGKGDIYSSSLWLGRPPTYTPLHRDPNPNLFVQICGRKVVRLLPPEVGDAVFDQVQSEVGGNAERAFRGEEMMVGRERDVLHEIVWDDGKGSGSGEGWMDYGCEASLGLGEALFIPKGWWHSVKGVGDGVTASANWWFR